MATTTQTQPQSPPIGWKQITIDLAIDGASETINGKWGQTRLNP